jgi:hypothetical protein
MKERNLKNNKFALPNLRNYHVVSTPEVDAEISLMMDTDGLIELTPKDLLQVCGGEGSYQGRRSTGGYVPT